MTEDNSPSQEDRLHYSFFPHLGISSEAVRRRIRELEQENSPQLSDRPSHITGREPELSGARRQSGFMLYGEPTIKRLIGGEMTIETRKPVCYKPGFTTFTLRFRW